MSTEAVSPLRRRVIEDMTIRQFGAHTQRDYIWQVRDFTVFLGQSPDRVEPEDLRPYQLHLASLGASYSRMSLASTALRFFFHTTLGRPGFDDPMARVPTPEPGGGGAAAPLHSPLHHASHDGASGSLRPRGEAEGLGRAERGLRLWPARVRGRPPQGDRHRQCPHADPRRAG